MRHVQRSEVAVNSTALAGQVLHRVGNRGLHDLLYFCDFLKAVFTVGVGGGVLQQAVAFGQFAAGFFDQIGIGGIRVQPCQCHGVLQHRLQSVRVGKVGGLANALYLADQGADYRGRKVGAALLCIDASEQGGANVHEVGDHHAGRLVVQRF